MSAHVDAPALAAPAATATGLPSRKLAVWLFLGSEILFFSALIFSYIVLRMTSPLPTPADPNPVGMWPTPHEIQHILNIPLTALNTFLLIVSSVSVVMALDAVQKGNKKALTRWLGVTLVLGITFLSIQGYEYVKLEDHGLWFNLLPDELGPQHLNRNVLMATTFFAMTGFHGMHVLAGVIMLLIFFVKAKLGLYTQSDHEGIELFGLYWHFVDLVWIILFTIVYLL
ncbi:MAG: heme-copper oxidase subunit III [Ardenticatenales bacterium]|nr:heme-copper oxidase subunit III [Ardenticatenales bacterium]